MKCEAFFLRHPVHNSECKEARVTSILLQLTNPAESNESEGLRNEAEKCSGVFTLFTSNEIIPDKLITSER